MDWVFGALDDLLQVVRTQTVLSAKNQNLYAQRWLADKQNTALASRAVFWTAFKLRVTNSLQFCWNSRTVWYNDLIHQEHRRNEMKVGALIVQGMGGHEPVEYEIFARYCRSDWARVSYPGCFLDRDKLCRCPVYRSGP